MKPKLRYAAAIAALTVGGVASAHTLVANPGAVTFSRQGAQLTGSTATTGLPGIDVTLGADYSVNDNIDLTIAGATVGGATNANLAVAANVDCGAGMIISFVARTGNVISLRVTQKTVANTVGVVCTIADDAIEVTDPSIAAANFGTDITATWAARTAITNIPFDPQTAPAGAFALATVIDQFTSAVTQQLNQVVDVNDPSLRTDFVDDGTDVLTVTATNTNGTDGPNADPAAANGVVVTINGNVSHIDADADGCENAELAGVISTSAGTLTVASNCLSLTITDGAQPAANTTRTYNVTFDDNAGILVAPQTFSASVQFNYEVGAATGTETDNHAAGAWTLNGFIAFVSYMPYGANITQIIYLANDSNQTGAVNIAARNTAGVACNFPAGSVQGNRVSMLTQLIKTGLEGCYGVGFTDKVQFTLTANIPQTAGDLYTAYNVGGSDRGTVVNDSNGHQAVVVVPGS